MSRRHSSAVAPCASVRRRRHVPLLIEPIEPRRLLAASLSGSVLNITGTANADAFTVKLSGTNLVVQRAGESAQSFARSAVAKIVVTLGNGNDSILIDDAVTAPASILGEAGDDTLRGGLGNDTIDGGPGNDTVTYAGRTTKVTASLIGSAKYASGTSGPKVYTSAGTGGSSGESDAFRDVDTLVGGEAGDDLRLRVDYTTAVSSGTPLLTIRQSLNGGAGNDTINVGSDFDQGDGNVLFYQTADGGAGNDTFTYSGTYESTTTLLGNSGDDTFRNGSDDQKAVVSGGAGYDHWIVNSPFGGIVMPADLERATLNAINGVVTGNDLDNVIEVNGGTVDARGGNDRVSVIANGSSALRAATLNGGAGNDTLVGGAYDDVIDGGLGNDSIDGGGGTDTVDYSARTASVTGTLRVDFDRQEVRYGSIFVPRLGGGAGVAGESDALANLETIVGGSGNDALTLHSAEVGGGAYGDPVTLRAVGGAGNDRIELSHYYTGGHDAVSLYGDGGVGDDSFTYSSTANHIAGGDGNDTFRNDDDDSTATIDAGAGRDVLTLYRTVNYYSMPAGLEVVNASGGWVNITGNGEANEINVPAGATVAGGGGNDRITVTRGSGSSASSLSGGDGNDTILGGDGYDTIDGGDGSDVIDGGLGNDWFDGGGGNDTVTYAGRTTPVNATLFAYVIFPNGAAQPGVSFSSGGGGVEGEADSYVGFETLVGGDGSDYLSIGIGESAASSDLPVDLSLLGGAGNDVLAGETRTRRNNVRLVINGGSGNDYFVGNYPSVTPTLIGGDGDDRFNNFATSTLAAVDAGAGFDLWSVGSTPETVRSITMPAGLEHLFVSYRADVIGNDEANRIEVGGGRIDARGGNDFVLVHSTGVSFPATILGGAGNDSLEGGPSNDSIEGGDGDDTIQGGAGSDRLFGNAGNDRFEAARGNDTVDGGAGGDALAYTTFGIPVTGQLSASLVTVGGKPAVRREVRASFDPGATDTTTTGVDVEVLTGGYGNDTLSAFANGGAWDTTAGLDLSQLIINGSGGNDVLSVRGVVNGTSVARTPGMLALGGDGNDDLSATATTAAIAQLDAGNGDDLLTFAGNLGYFSALGGVGRDTLRIRDRSYQAAALTVTLANDVEDADVQAGARVDVVGNALANRIAVNAPGTSIQGLGGNDTIVGSESADTLDGGDGNDSITGNGGNDVLYGYAGNDSLFGGGGLDKLYGGNDNDRLDGGAGVDSIYGEAGTDTAVRDPADIVNSIEAYA